MTEDAHVMVRRGGPASRVSLLSAPELREVLAGQPPPLLLEACVSQQQQPSSVIPGAVLFCLEEIDVYLEDDNGQPQQVSGNYSLRPASELRAALERVGCQHVRHTVVYTQATRSGGLDLAVAARLAWCLAYCGVEHVSLFPGGVDAWRQAGLSVAPQPAASLRAPFFEGAPDGIEQTFPMHPEFLASTAEVEAAVDAAAGSGRAVQLVDVRSWGEYSGGGNVSRALPTRSHK